MTLALLGGTFNPLHLGHIHLAQVVRKELNYDKILFVPSFIPAHKKITNSVSPEERLQIVQHSIEGYPWALFSDCELRRKGVSYTVDTLRHVYDSYEFEGKPGLIIGDDLAEGFINWRDTSTILQLADLVVAHRLYEKEVHLDFPHSYINNEIFTMSSSELRSLANEGKPISSYIPEKAAQYILEQKLYETTAKRN